MLDLVRACGGWGDPFLVVYESATAIYTLVTARQLEKRGLVEVGSTSRKGHLGREYEVTLLPAGCEGAVTP